MRVLASFKVLFLVFFFISCSETANDESQVATTYGFGLQAYIEEYGTPDSASVWVMEGADTLQTLHFLPEDMDLEEGVVSFNIDADREAQITVLYFIYSNGEATAGGRQTFVSGETPSVPRPQFKPEISAGSDTTISRNTSFAFDLSVELREDHIEEYSLDIDGDGEVDYSNGVNANFAHIYETAEVYTAIFSVEDDLGLRDADTVEVSVQNPPPTVQIVAFHSVSVGAAVPMEIQAESEYGQIVEYSWDFDGDGTFDSTGTLAALSYTYSEVGDYELIVQVRDAEGFFTSDSFSIQVNGRVDNDPPTITAIMSDTSIFISDTLLLWAESDDPDGFSDVAEYSWDFDGDDVFDTSFSSSLLKRNEVLHNWNDTGLHIVQFRVRDISGASQLSEDLFGELEVRVVNCAPEASILASATMVSLNDEVTLSLSSISDADNNAIDSVYWDLSGTGSGAFSTARSLSESVTYSNANAGAYSIRARVHDIWGAWDTATVTIEVLEDLPLIDNLADINSVINAEVHLAPDISSGALGVGSVVSCEWNIGASGWQEVSTSCDTTITMPATPQVGYSAELRITDDDGNEATQSISIWVRDGFIDSRDGNFYVITTIGNQVWMAENLKYLPQVDNVEDGSEDVANGKYYYVYGYTPTGASEAEEIANAKATSNYETYGVLYNWYAAMDGATNSWTNPSGVQGVCPDGWHLPSDAEWVELSDFVDLDNDGDDTNNNEGISLKATSGWYDDGNGSDEYGFSALPGGYRRSGGNFIYAGYGGDWWSATEYTSSYAYYRSLRYSYSNLSRDEINKSLGYSIRCVMNP